MANLLNYKYEIFPTTPQREQLNRILREGRLQWNKAVTIRRKLKTALRSGQVEHVINIYLSYEKNNTQGRRREAILKYQASKPEYAALDFDAAAKIYSLKNLTGKVIDMDTRYLDTSLLTSEFKKRYDEELTEWKKAKTDGVETKKLPKRPVFWQLMSAVNDCAGVAAKVYMDKSFESPARMSLGSVRAFISGYAKSIRWNQAVKPKKGQRVYGARGEPQYKKRGEGFACQETDPASKLICNKKKGNGHLISINALPKGMRWVNLAYHRPISDESNIKQLTVNSRGGRYFVVLSVEVPDSAWQIAPMNAGWHAGIDPGAQTALTVGLRNSNSGELKHLAIHYEFLEKSLGKLEKMQQAIALKQGPRRKRTEEEIKEALDKYSFKSSIRKLPQAERQKAIGKRKEWLERTMIPNENGASKRWRRWSQRVSTLQFKIASRRADVLHKISRALAEGCDVVGIGHWEPEREISYRKKLRAAKKKVKLGIVGATEELKALEEEKSKQGAKGSVKKRRGGRDRSIATLRRLVDEKAERASTTALTDINEAGSTYTCCVCGSASGPKGDISIREWRCNECNTLHHRDLNSAFNILEKTETEIASAQEAAQATAPTVTRPTAQGATGQAGSNSGFRATETSGRGDSFFYEYADRIQPNLWDEEVPKALNSLIQMGIVRPLSMQTDAKAGFENPP